MIAVTKEELVSAFEAWYSDYMDDPSVYPEYDGFDNASLYAVAAAESLIAHINKVKGE